MERCGCPARLIICPGHKRERPMMLLKRPGIQETFAFVLQHERYLI